MTDIKSALRTNMRKQLNKLSLETRHSKSLQICHHLKQSPYLRKAEPILSFSALPDEPELLPLYNKRKSKQVFCFPKVTGSKLEIRHVSNASDLTPGYANILEPSAAKCPLFAAQNLRIILLPGLAFDPTSGGRLGKGKGFYDRLLSELKSNSSSPLVTIGICFSCQLTQVPLERHDQNVGLIVTEQGLIDLTGDE